MSKPKEKQKSLNTSPIGPKDEGTVILKLDSNGDLYEFTLSSRNIPAADYSSYPDNKDYWGTISDKYNRTGSDTWKISSSADYNIHNKSLDGRNLVLQNDMGKLETSLKNDKRVDKNTFISTVHMAITHDYPYPDTKEALKPLKEFMESSNIDIKQIVVERNGKPTAIYKTDNKSIPAGKEAVQIILNDEQYKLEHDIPIKRFEGKELNKGLITLRLDKKNKPEYINFAEIFPEEVLSNHHMIFDRSNGISTFYTKTGENSWNYAKNVGNSVTTSNSPTHKTNNVLDELEKFVKSEAINQTEIIISSPGTPFMKYEKSNNTIGEGLDRINKIINSEKNQGVSIKNEKTNLEKEQTGAHGSELTKEGKLNIMDNIIKEQFNAKNQEHETEQEVCASVPVSKTGQLTPPVIDIATATGKIKIRA